MHLTTSASVRLAVESGWNRPKCDYLRSLLKKTHNYWGKFYLIVELSAVHWFSAALSVCLSSSTMELSVNNSFTPFLVTVAKSIILPLDVNYSGTTEEKSPWANCRLKRWQMFWSCTQQQIFVCYFWDFNMQMKHSSALENKKRVLYLLLPNMNNVIYLVIHLFFQEIMSNICWFQHL